MKLEIRWRDLTPTAVILDHVKQEVASRARPHPWSITRLRVTLIGEHDDWARCRIEVGLRSGGVRILEAMSSDLLFAIDAATDRFGELIEGLARRANERRAA